MHLVLGSERVLYDRVILEAELSVNDFEIMKEEGPPGTKVKDSMGDVAAGTITVTYKPTEIVRQYRDGVFPPPHLSFERELELNIFKTR